MRSIRITPKILEVYRHARKVYDDTDTDRQTVALEACSGLCDKLNVLLGRTNPWDVGIFATIDVDHPRDWENRRELARSETNFGLRLNVLCRLEMVASIKEMLPVLASLKARVDSASLERLEAAVRRHEATILSETKSPRGK